VGKRWSVVGMPVETINAIKNRAMEYGCSIPEVLATEFGGEAKHEAKKVWVLYNVPKEVQEELSRRARKIQKPIYLVLQDLLFKRGESDAEVSARIRKEFVKDMREYLKEFRKNS